MKTCYPVCTTHIQWWCRDVKASKSGTWHDSLDIMEAIDLNTRFDAPAHKAHLLGNLTKGHCTSPLGWDEVVPSMGVPRVVPSFTQLGGPPMVGGGLPQQVEDSSTLQMCPIMDSCQSTEDEFEVQNFKWVFNDCFMFSTKKWKHMGIFVNLVTFLLDWSCVSWCFGDLFDKKIKKKSFHDFLVIYLLKKSRKIIGIFANLIFFYIFSVDTSPGARHISKWPTSMLFSCIRQVIFFTTTIRWSQLHCTHVPSRISWSCGFTHVRGRIHWSCTFAMLLHSPEVHCVWHGNQLPRRWGLLTSEG